MGGHGIVGAQIAMGTGVAFAEQYNGTDNVAIVSMGDGAVRQGALHETFNMAMMWKLPVVYIIENNNYAMGTSVERTTNVTDLSKIGLSYEMPSKIVNGMRPEDVHNAIEEACNRARKGDGPTLLDIRTYRYKGHSMSDPQKYRSKEEVSEWIEQDPIEHCLQVIKENSWFDERIVFEINDTYNTLDKACKARFDLFQLPSTAQYKKILYLDTDILVKGDLRKVFEVCQKDLLYVL